MNEIRFTLRLDDDLHKAITQLAAKNRRSMNAEIVVAIERAIENADSIFNLQIQATQPQPVAQKVARQDD